MHMALGLKSNLPTRELISGWAWIGVVCLAVLILEKIHVTLSYFNLDRPLKLIGFHQ